MSVGRTARLTLPPHHPGQAKMAAEERRFNVGCAGRRTGKTVYGIDRLIQPAIGGLPGPHRGIAYPVAWGSPTYKMLEEAWRETKEVVAPIISRTNEQSHRIELQTGGVIEFWSLEEGGSIRGRKYMRWVIDEAAKVKTLLPLWNAVIRPTLVDFRGDAFFFSTPNGYDDFKDLFDRGDKSHTMHLEEDVWPEWISWQMPTSVNPYIHPDEIAEMKRNLPAQIYDQEVLAKFNADGAAAIRGVLDCINPTCWRDHAEKGHRYAIGADWGRTKDFTVFTVVDLTTKTVVHVDRFQEIGFDVQEGRLKALYERFKAYVIIPEYNAIGIPVIDALQRMGLPIQPFISSNATKAQVIESLGLAFEQRQITIPNYTPLVEELQQLRPERTPSGLTRYAAPGDKHDDCVISLALAWSAVDTGGSLFFFGGEDEDLEIHEDDDEGTMYRKLTRLRELAQEARAEAAFMNSGGRED